MSLKPTQWHCMFSIGFIFRIYLCFPQTFTPEWKVWTKHCLSPTLSPSVPEVDYDFSSFWHYSWHSSWFLYGWAAWSSSYQVIWVSATYHLGFRVLARHISWDIKSSSFMEHFNSLKTQLLINSIFFGVFHCISWPIALSPLWLFLIHSQSNLWYQIATRHFIFKTLCLK